MGCSKGSCRDRENFMRKTTHSVKLSNFYIGKYEVTQKQWRLIMGTTAEQQRNITAKETPVESGWAKGGEGDNNPMYYVSWNEAQEFIRRLNAATGKRYRLPTEAEWEYAARGGAKSKGYRYSGSNNIDSVAWYEGNNSGSTQPVGTKLPNELGVYDMSGSVFEWCSDWYDKYPASAQSNPVGASSGPERVFRGGCWFLDPSFSHVASRSSGRPEKVRISALGFRLVHP